MDEFFGKLIIGKEETPYTILVADHGAGPAVPVVEVADEAKLKRPRRPLAIPDPRLAMELAAIEAEVVVALADIAHQPPGRRDARQRVVIIRISIGEPRGVRLEPGIEISQIASGRSLGGGHDVASLYT